MKFVLWILLVLLIPIIGWADVPATGSSHPTARIQVEATGNTIEDAKRVGFRSAIEQVVGVVIVAEVESSNDQLIKDFIGSYSAGVIASYEILDKYQTSDGKFTVKMNVEVASSKIAQRMLASNNRSLVINGQQLQAQLESRFEEKINGDGLIHTVLSGYPQQAYIINNGQTEAKISPRRQAYLDIQVEISMSKFWIEALDEALTTAAIDSRECNTLVMVVANGIKKGPFSPSVGRLINRTCGNEPDIGIKKSGSWFFNNYYLSDLETLRMINGELNPAVGKSMIGLKTSLLDAAGHAVHEICDQISTESFIKYESPNLSKVNLNERKHYLRPLINGKNVLSGTVIVPLTDIDKVEDIVRARITIEKTCT
jgi:hypothetical protein